MRGPLKLRDGGELEIWGDIVNGEPLAIMFMRCNYEFGGEQVTLPGAQFTPERGTNVEINASVVLDPEQAQTIADMLTLATSPLTEDEQEEIAEREASE